MSDVSPTPDDQLPAHILVVEDDGAIAGSIAQCLEDAGYRVTTADSGEAGLAEATADRFTAMIVDRMLPGLTGMELVGRLRDAGQRIPILMLSALGQLQDRIDGLDVGADDYLVKPVAHAELLARLRAAIRRSASVDTPHHLSAGPIFLNLTDRTAWRDGKRVVLQPREFRLLEELVRNAGNFVSRSMLIERVWNLRFDPGTKIIETHVSRLRSKLNQHGADVIETVRGVGYRIRID